MSVELLEMLTGENPERYNCSGKTHEEWLKTGEISPILSIYYLVSGVVFQLIALPVLFVIYTSDLYKYSCYKIMFYIGVVELTEIWGVSIWPGISAWIGAVYCSHPVIETLVGKITMIQWLSGTLACVLLAVNRLIDVRIGSGASKRWNWFFEKSSRVYALLVLITLYGIYGSIFYDTVLFNSVYMSPLLNPMIGTDHIYVNKFLSFHNLTVCIAIIVIYTILSYSRLRCNFWKGSSSFQRHVLIQSIMISMIYSTPAIMFVVIYYIDSPSYFLVQFSDISYQLTGGLPCIVYISMNRRIRSKIIGLIPKKRLSSEINPSISSRI